MPEYPSSADLGVKVNPNASILDTLYAAGRLVTVIITSVPILLTLIGSHNLMGMIDYFRGSGGSQLVGAIVGLVAIAVGLAKTFRRGKLAVTVAASREVPNSIVSLK